MVRRIYSGTLVGPLLVLLLAHLPGCGEPAPPEPAREEAAPGLPPEGAAAAETLSQALRARDVDGVSRAARAAAAWQGKDAALDRMLGDALANVLMRPAEGLPLLQANPAPADPAWRRAIQGAALRAEDHEALRAAWSLDGQEPPNFEVSLLPQIAARARQDPGFDVARVAPLLWRCDLLRRRPTTGRRTLAMPVEGDLLAAGRALGAQGFVVARSLLQVDMGSGAEVWRCADMVMLEDAQIPSPLPPRVTVVGATDGRVDVYLELREEDGVPTAFVTSNAEWGARWMRAAALMGEAPSPEEGAARVKAALGSGLGGSALPKP